MNLDVHRWLTGNSALPADTVNAFGERNSDTIWQKKIIRISSRIQKLIENDLGLECELT